MGIRLSTQEAWAELAGSHTGILTTLRADGTPIALPVWFVALDGRIYVSGPSHTKKFARVARNPRCSFLVESGERWAELRAVHFTGTATAVTSVTDAALLERVGAALDEKYRSFRTNADAMPDATRQHYDVENTTIEIVPDDRILSWDNTRLGVGFDG